MKKPVFFTFMAAVFLFLTAQAHAARALDLSGNDYTVYILCSEDLGDFCDQGRPKTDTFIFDGESDNFGIESFEDALWGLAGYGEYSSGGLSFDAHYEAVDGLEAYEFDIRGLTIVDIILFGTMDISYTEPDDLFGGNPTEGRAFFFGIKN